MSDPEAVIAAARQWLGTPYRHQGSTLGAGCDCLGLLRGVWRKLYGAEPMPVPPYRADMRDVAHGGALREAAEALLVQAEELEAGAVVLFRLNRAVAPKHCGILVDPQRFIHAQERLGVVEASLGESWRRRVAGVWRFP